MSPDCGRGWRLWGSHRAVTRGSLGTGRGCRKATEGKGTDWSWGTDESDRELGITWSLNPAGTLHRGRGEGEEEEEAPGTLGLRACSGVDEDLGRRCRMEEKKEQDSGRGMVPIPLSNVRIVQPEHIIVFLVFTSVCKL